MATTPSLFAYSAAPRSSSSVCVGARFVVSPSVAERKGDKDKAAAAAVQLASFWVVTRFSDAASSISGLILQLIH